MNTQQQGYPDIDAIKTAGAGLERAVRLQAKSIADKYIAPPHTTDFALLFLANEGLYAEVVRRPGLVDALQREQRVVLAGPTTPYHWSASKPGKPASATVGTLGSAGMRWGDETAIALIWPARIWASTAGMPVNKACTWPATRSLTAGAVPL